MSDTKKLLLSPNKEGRSMATGGWTPPPSFAPPPQDHHHNHHSNRSNAGAVAELSSPTINNNSNKSLDDYRQASNTSNLSSSSFDDKKKKKKVFHPEHVFIPDSAMSASLSDLEFSLRRDAPPTKTPFTSRAYHSQGNNLDLEFDLHEDDKHQTKGTRGKPQPAIAGKGVQYHDGHVDQDHHIDVKPLATGHYDEDRQHHTTVQVDVTKPSVSTIPKAKAVTIAPTTTTTNSPKAPVNQSKGRPPTGKSRAPRLNWDDTVPTNFDDFEYDDDFAPQIRHDPPHSHIRKTPRNNPHRMSVAPTPSVSRKSILIGDKAALETRLKWNQLLVRNALSPYCRMICELDDLLPDPDELDKFRDDEHDDDKHELDFVRNAMLDDFALSEKEIAAFFEGYALFNMKVRSLQAQLNASKMMTATSPRATLFGSHIAVVRSMGNLYEDDDDDEPNWKPITTTDTTAPPLAHPREQLAKSKSGFRQGIMLASKGIGPPPSESGPMSTASTSQPVKMRSQPGNLGKSLRMLSIKKAQKSPETNENVQKLLKELEEAEKRQKKLEKQLQQAGVVIAEDIPYEEAKNKVGSIAKRMQEIGGSDVSHPDPEEQKKLREEYFKLEQDMEKYNAALMLTDEWVEEQEEMEQKWEDDHAPGNMEALMKVRRHMPVNVRHMSEEALATTPTPNGRYIHREMAKKFKRTNVLQLLRLNPEDILRMHPSTLENMRVTGLTLTERRALYAHLKDIGPRWKSMQADKMTERKWVWYTMMKTNFKENLEIYLRHVERYGPPGNHPYATRDNPDAGCPLIGKQCPLKADKVLDYDGDLGFTPEAEYEVSEVRKSDIDDPGARAKQEALELIREKKAGERSETLKKHYKNNVLQVSLANGSCEAMDALIDSIENHHQKWLEDRFAAGTETTEDSIRKEMTGFNEALNELKLAVLQFADRSGMQLTGKKDANAGNPDIRSPVELGLCEEVYEIAEDFFKGIQERMTEIKVKDGRMKSNIEQMRDLLEELHERNMATLAKLGCPRPAKSRKLKKRQDIWAEIKKKAAAVTEVEEAAPPATTRDVGGGGRGALLGAIAGRGRGASDDAGGRGDLLTAIAGRGRGRGRGDLLSAIAGRGRGSDGEGGRGGGRGDLLSAIAGRGRGSDGEGGRGGGRGDLLSAIAGRGRGDDAGGRGGGGGGRGDLLAALTARGRGRGDPRGGRGGGRGDLMAAIAARGEGGRGGGGRPEEGAGGGRGDLMAAIGGRARGDGRGDGSNRSGGGSRGGGRGRGSLMAAIAAQGQASSRAVQE